MKSLDLLIIRKLDDYMLRHPNIGASLAQNVRYEYEAMPLKGKPVKWSPSTDEAVRKNSDWVKLKGYIGRTHHMPAALVTPCLMALPEQDRNDVLAEFCESFKQMLVPRPTLDGKKITTMAAAAKFLKEMSEAFAALSELLQRGDLDSASVQAIRKALLEIGEADAALEQVRALLVAALPTGDVIELKKKA